MGLFNSIGRLLNPWTAFEEAEQIDAMVPSLDISDVAAGAVEKADDLFQQAWHGAVNMVSSHKSEVEPVDNDVSSDESIKPPSTPSGAAPKAKIKR